MSEDVKLLSAPTNYAVVQLPKRAFPGVVFQGDSLNILISELEEARAESDPHEREAALSRLVDNLRQIQAHYEQALNRQGISLPYHRP